MAKGIARLEPYNPLEKRHLGESVADALLQTPPVAMPPGQFVGAGVYALYYAGSFPAYSVLVEKNRNGQFLSPIYIGKAVPTGARKGGLGIDVGHGQALSKRLYEHSESIRSATNLEIADFFCRFLVVEDIWIPLVESMLIERFMPVWNRVLDGFGNHDPGSGRHGGKMPQWDCMHPGRTWAKKLQPCAYGLAELEKRVVEFLTL